MIIAAADGSSLSNPGPAGWAWFIDGDRWAAGGWKHGTNNMGELMAVLDLLRQTRDADDDLLVMCDSQYVINALTKWLPGWKRKGWRKADGKPVLNVELLQDLDRELQGRRVTFEWVKGHAGQELNEAADARARAAATAFQKGLPVNEGPGFSATVIRTPTPDLSPGPRREPDLFDAAPDPAEDPDEHPVVALQRQWVSDAVRSDRSAAEALLHPKFLEHDVAGRASGKGRTLATLKPYDDPVTVEVEGIDELAPWVVHLRWRARSRSAVSLRSSIWVKANDSWRLRFEQQTPASR
ncbi:ribonuclease HI family protein [Propioniciclava sinopodophylli]|uniref:Ribonuclease H n=1 Tax=Propioniciclava sinopodophylli TaxID=1837344 RepID=A0A4Q9KG58_9ACTN|nr:ribonuclease HI family protein [Propioniciclava sinopodophylli]TBT87418.1 ribonuclease HI family protein [Propioniciclava sinopodophylli]